MVSVISGRNAQAVAAAAAAYGVAEHTTDWRAVIGRDDIDIVDICTPPGTHAEIAAAAAAAGKAVLCEKPLAVTYEDAAAALAAVTTAGVPNAVSFNYRRLPAVSLMRRMIADGAIGELRLWRATWLSDEFTDPATPFDWRFDRPWAGRPSPTWAAISSTWRTGRPADPRGLRPGGDVHTRRPLPGGGTRDVTVDDAASALLRFDSGAIGTMEVARAAVRRPCDFTVEANGSEGTLVFDYARLNELRYGRAGDDQGLYGMRRIRAEHPATPMPPTGGRSGRASATVRASSTRSPTCWKAGPARRGRPASTTVPRHRRSVPPSRPRRPRTGGSTSAK